MTTIAPAWLVLRERLARRRELGIVAVLAGVALISVVPL